MAYTSQTISNYNDDPPPDDGSAVAANQIKFSTVKDELADPIRVLAQAINTELLSAFSSLFLGNTENKATTFNVATTDDGTLFNCTAPLTVNLPPAVDAGEGFAVVIFNNSGGTITIDGDSSETINGNATVTLTNDLDAFILVSTGSLWHGIKIETLSGFLGDDNTFTGNNTFSGTNTFSNDVTFTGDVLFPDDGELTISSGAITVTGVYHTVDTAADAASDDLDTINTGADGQRLIFRPDNTARTIVVKDGTGNIKTSDGNDITLDTTEKTISLIFDGALSKWIQVGGGGGGLIGIQSFTADGTYTPTAGTNSVMVFCTGGGGGGGNGAGNGGTSSFGAFCSATGGKGVGTTPVGVGSGGIINIAGGIGERDPDTSIVVGGGASFWAGTSSTTGDAFGAGGFSDDGGQSSGSAGGTAIDFISSGFSGTSVTVGAAGTIGNGGPGGGGIVVVFEFG